ncbi:metallophosphoesterase [Candidatus Pacearchaeota archaeon]|nr:metallophosphoesterase [Candidatus Pacearchaeota archaeon]
MEKKFRILAAGDLHGSLDIARKLSAKGKKGKVDLVVLAGDIYGYNGEGEGILDCFGKAGQKIIFVPGNLDFDEDLEGLEKIGKNIHNYYVTYGDVGILGIGSGNWKLRLKEKDLEDVRGNFSRMKHKKRILVSHLHAAGTLAELSGVPGDEVLRKAVEEFAPDLLISAHIHEGEGILDWIGGTRVIQVGKSGTIIEI